MKRELSLNEELLQGKVAWEIQQKEYGPSFCNQIQEAVRKVGADNYYALMMVNRTTEEVSKEACHLMYLSLKYVEHFIKTNYNKN